APSATLCASRLPAAVAAALTESATVGSLYLVQRGLQFLPRGGHVLKKLDFRVEVNDEGAVFPRTHHLVKECVTGVALLIEHPQLAEAGINQQSQREWQICVARKILD